MCKLNYILQFRDVEQVDKLLSRRVFVNGRDQLLAASDGLFSGT
jgi:hypothetical protein